MRIILVLRCHQIVAVVGGHPALDQWHQSAALQFLFDQIVRDQPHPQRRSCRRDDHQELIKIFARHRHWPINLKIFQILLPGKGTGRQMQQRNRAKVLRSLEPVLFNKRRARQRGSKSRYTDSAGLHRANRPCQNARPDQTVLPTCQKVQAAWTG